MHPLPVTIKSAGMLVSIIWRSIEHFPDVFLPLVSQLLSRRRFQIHEVTEVYSYSCIFFNQDKVCGGAVNDFYFNWAVCDNWSNLDFNSLLKYVPCINFKFCREEGRGTELTNNSFFFCNSLKEVCHWQFHKSFFKCLNIQSFCRKLCEFG